MSLPSSEWPQGKVTSVEEETEVEKERKPKSVVAAMAMAAVAESNEGNLMGWKLRAMNNYGSYIKTTRVMAWILRALLNSRRRRPRYGNVTVEVSGKAVPAVTGSEINFARLILFREVQKMAF